MTGKSRLGDAMILQRLLKSLMRGRPVHHNNASTCQQMIVAQRAKYVQAYPRADQRDQQRTFLLNQAKKLMKGLATILKWTWKSIVKGTTENQCTLWNMKNKKIHTKYKFTRQYLFIWLFLRTFQFFDGHPIFNFIWLISLHFRPV